MKLLNFSFMQILYFLEICHMLDIQKYWMYVKDGGIE